MPYAPYVERLIEEHKQLSERLDKLAAFLEGETFKYLPSAEQVLLRLQRQQMTAYQSTLQQRLALLNIRSNTMHASTEPQTTEPKTLDIASLYEKGVFVTVDDHEDLPFDAAIREAGQALIQAVSSVFELRGTHFSIMVRPVETAQERRVCLLRDGAVAVTVKKN